MLGHRKLEPEEYIQILKRRAWLIAIPLTIFPLLALAITFFVQPRYISQTLVLIDQQKIPDEYVKSVVSSDLDTRLASMKEQILSRSRLQPIIDRYNLYANLHVSMEERTDNARKNNALKAIHSDITNAGGLPGFFITFQANDPRTAQAICGEITSLFVNENLRSREASAEGTTDFLKGQLDDAKHSLDEQDAKLAAFQSQFAGKLPDEESPNVNMLTSLNTQLEAATEALNRMEQDRTYLQSMLAQVAPGANGSSTPAATVPNAIKQSRQAELRTMESQEAELAATYTADYPDVIAARRKIADLRAQIAKLPDMVPAGSASASATEQSESTSALQLRAQLRASDSAIQAKRNEQSMLQAQVRTYQDRIAASPGVDQQYKLLTRDYDTAKKFYDDLLAKMNQSRMATDLESRQEGEQFHVMDQPNLPDAPVFPNRFFFLVAGIAAGLIVGTLWAGILEYRDTSLRNEQDVWAFTNLPTLAVIPMASADTEPSPPQQTRRFFGKPKLPKALAVGGRS